MRVDDLTAEANTRVERWMLGQFRREMYNVLGRLIPGPEVHLLCCPDASAGPVSGGEEDISAATVGGMVYLETWISCPHGHTHLYVHYEQGGLTEIIDDLEGQKVKPLAGPNGYFHLHCPTCTRSVATHLLRPNTTVKSRMDHEHPVELVVVDGFGNEVERHPLPVKERYEVRLPRP